MITFELPWDTGFLDVLSTLERKKHHFLTFEKWKKRQGAELLWHDTQSSTTQSSTRVIPNLRNPSSSFRNLRGGPHTYINCDPILSFLGACESWFQQRFLLHKGEKNSCHFGSEKVAILDDPEIWSFLVVIQCLFWNVWFAETAGVSAMRRDGK